MTVNDWHAPSDLLDRFAADPSAVEGVRAASLEAHLLACDQCREAVSSRTSTDFLEQSWSAVAAQIDEPHLSVVERVLCRLGVSEGTARLLGATPGLSLAGLLAVVAIAAGAVVSSRSTDTAGAFLVVAPLLPLLAVAGTFSSVADPAGEAGIVTPLHGLGLALRRSVVVLAVVFFALGVADLAVGELGVPVLAWVLPSWALAACAMALTTWFRAESAAVGLGLAWTLLVLVTRWAEGHTAAYAEAVVFAPAGQVAALVVLAGATWVVVVRRAHFQTMEVIR